MTRRIVTGHDDAGRSVILQDSEAPNTEEWTDVAGCLWRELWVVDDAPADNRGTADNADRPISLEPPERGNVFRIVDIPPDIQRYGPELDRSRIRRRVGGSEAYDRGDPKHLERHPGYHKTRTLDYAIVLEGKIVAMMEEGETEMGPGDVLIQRGTNHAWSNRSDKPCKMAFVLIDGQELP